MKKLILIFAVVLLVLVACSEEDTPAPQIEVQVNTDGGGDDGEEPIIQDTVTVIVNP